LEVSIPITNFFTKVSGVIIQIMANILSLKKIDFW
jgi:hypothetical protein